MQTQRDFTLEPDDIERLANLSGPFDAHLRMIELRLGVEIANRGNVFRVSGHDADAVARSERLLRQLYAEAADETLDEHAIHLQLGAFAGEEHASPRQAAAHFTKLECFCFNQYTLEPGEKKEWPVAFVIDPRLSKDVTTITLSYTFFEVGGKTPAAPQSTAAALPATSAEAGS